MAEALLALGGNVGNARKTLREATLAFCDGEKVQLKTRSSDYRTPPWGITEQPAFMNACIAVTTKLSPRDLLLRAKTIEQAFGRDRDREERWGPRTLDIDLIAYDDVSVSEPGLILPHPRLFERAFVLAPLAEIVPDRVISGRKIRDALAALDQTGIVRLADYTGNDM